MKLVFTDQQRTDMAQAIFNDNAAKGWWDDMDRCPWTTLQLMNTEASEASEGERRNLMDDKIKTRKMGEVELADMWIRVADYGGRYGLRSELDLNDGWMRSRLTVTCLDAESIYFAATTPLGKHLALSMAVTAFAQTIWKYQSADAMPKNIVVYGFLLGLIEKCSLDLGYDLPGAIAEKRAFNKTRPDHKRANRAKDNGKKW